MELFDNFQWDVSSGDLNDIQYVDPNTSNRLVVGQSSALIQQFSQPLPIPALKIYFPYGDDISDAYSIMSYPPNMSVLQILGAIHTYFQQPVTLHEMQYADEPNADYNIEMANRIRQGQIVRRYELFDPDVFFKGFVPHEDGYELSLYKK